MERRSLATVLRVLPVLAFLSVGVACTVLADSAPAVGYRPMTVMSPVRGGEVPVAIWYPVVSDADVGTPVGDSRVFEPTPIRTGAHPQGRHPLLVIAHGGLRSGGHIGDWLAAGLAGRGYVVALVDPAPFEPDAAAVFRELSARPADMSAVISALLGSREFSSAIDPARIGAVGLLRGGTSAMALLGARVNGERYAALCERSPDDLDCRWFSKTGISLAGQDLAQGTVDRRDLRVAAAIAVAPELTSVMVLDELTADDRALSVLLLNDAAIPGSRPGDLAAYLSPDRLGTLAGITPFSLFPVCTAKAAELLREDGEDDSLCREQAGRDRRQIHRELTDLIVRTLSEQGLAPAR